MGEQATLLAVALAYVRTSAVILLDDLDRDIPSAVRPPLAAGAASARRRPGPAIIATATDRSAVAGADSIVELEPARRPAAVVVRSGILLAAGHPMIKTVKLAGYELRRFKGPLPIIALLFLLLIPSLYGALYLWSSWDPYGKLDQVPVAVVNEDVPATGPDGQTIDAGDRLVAELQDDPIFDWQFVDATTAAARTGRRHVLPDDHHPAGLLGEPGQRRHR